MGIELLDAPAAIGVAQAGVEVLREVPVVARFRREMAERGDSPERGAGIEFGDQRPDRGAPLGRRKGDPGTAGARAGTVLNGSRCHGLESGAGEIRTVQESRG